MPKWTKEEEDTVDENFGVKPIRVWRDQLPNRTVGAIRKKAQRMGLYSAVTCADFPPPRYKPELPKASDMTFNELWEATLAFQRMALELSTRLDPVNVYLDVDQPIGVGFLADAHIGSISTPLDVVRSRFELMREQPWLYLVSDGDTIDNFLPTSHAQGMFGTMFPPELQKELVLNLYMKMEGRWLALVQGCFLAGTKILMSDGTEKTIEQIKTGDFVFSNGVSQTVSKTYNNYWNGELITLNVMGIQSQIQATSNHEFLSRRRLDKRNKNGTRATRQVKDSEWLSAKELKQGDFLGIPRINGIVPPKYSIEDMLIFGWWLAEGSYTRMDAINFCLGEDERIHAETIKEYFEEKGHSVYFHERPKRHTIELSINSRSLAKEYLTLFGKYCDGKRIPTMFLYYPQEHQKALITGLTLGDGHQRNNSGEEIAWTTTSPLLQSQIRHILFRHGTFVSTSYYERDGKKPYWVLTWRLNPQRSRHLVDENYVWVPIMEKTTTTYTGATYNLEVETTHTYEVGGVNVKNCHEEFSHDADDFDFTKYLASAVGAANMGFGGQVNLYVGEQLYQIALRHKYRYNSSFNYTHTCKRLREREYPNADIVCVAHHHQATIEQMAHSDKDRIYIRPGSMKGPDRYARSLGYTDTGSQIPTVILWPDKRKMLSFLNLEDAIEVVKEWY